MSDITTDLCKIAEKYGTDKVSQGYTLYYDESLKHLRNNKINMLEIGIFRGGSILMWNEYFQKGEIYCIDNCIPNSSGHLLCNQSVLDNLNNYSERIHAYDCCQKDNIKMENIFSNITFDLIVDDGEHFQEHMLKSFGNLFKKVNSGGIYIIEDICTMWGFQTGSWWGQKNGIENTSRGKNSWLQKFIQNNKLEEEEVYKDAVWYVLHNYLKSNVFYSEYLSDDDNKYLTDNIENIEIIAAPEEREKYLHDNYNIPKYSGTLNTKLKAGCIAIIRKK